MSFKSGFVAIIGRPNAGKSTLLNTILETELSIVTPKAQTTREKILGILTETQGQIVFIDTPGIHQAKEGGINEVMMREARESLAAPSLIWYLADPNSTLKHEQAVLELLVGTSTPVFLLMNKCDQKTNGTLEEALVQAAKDLKIPIVCSMSISARKKAGLEELLDKSWELLSDGPLYYPDTEQLSDRPMRFFVAEKIREQLFHLLGEEVPYSCAVEIDQFDEKAKPPRIEATIFVERESQKGIVIGKGGAKVKEIGQSARRKIEELLGGQVFLGLRVKLLKDWSKDSTALKRLGYSLQKKG